MNQGMQLESEIPARRAFAEIGSVFSQQADPPVPNRFAYWDWLAVNQIQRFVERPQCGPDESADKAGQIVQAPQPLLVATQLWERIAKERSNEQICPFESLTAEYSLHESDCDHLRIGKGWPRIGRPTPGRQIRISREIVVNENKDGQKLIRNGYSIQRSFSSV